MIREGSLLEKIEADRDIINGNFENLGTSSMYSEVAQNFNFSQLIYIYKNLSTIPRCDVTILKNIYARSNETFVSIIRSAGRKVRKYSQRHRIFVQRFTEKGEDKSR